MPRAEKHSERIKSSGERAKVSGERTKTSGERAKPSGERTRSAVSAAKRDRLRKKRRRDVLIALGVFLLVGVAVGLLLLFSMNVDAITLYEPVYKYQVTERIDYRGMTQLSFDEGVTTLSNGNSVLQLGTDPLYYEGRDALLLPLDMVLVLPDRPLLARAERFSTLAYTETGIQLTRGNDSQMIGRGFLFDGQNQYIFLSEMRLKWQNLEESLSPLSSVATTSEGQILVIDHDSNEATLIDTAGGTVLAQSASGYEINLSADKLTLADGTETLLFARPEVLDPLF